MSDPAEAASAAHKISQILGEVLIHHAPHTAQINATVNDEHREQFLEDLEQHTSKIITPFLTRILDTATIPDELRPLIEEALTTPHQFSAIVTQIFLFGIVSQLLGTSVQPFLVGVSNDLSAAAVSSGISRPVDPSVIATAAGRGLNLGDPPTLTVPDWAYSEAAKSGVSADDINLQASIVGLPPALQELFELFRRGIIDLDQVKTGLREGDFRDDWIDNAVQLVHGWLTPLDFVRAAVQEQMSYEDAAQWAAKTGLDTSTTLPIDASAVGGSDDMFGLAWSIAGRPPGPEELARMTLRGIIDRDGTGAGATTFQQGIAESDVKTKWTDALWQLAQYVPPPAEIGGLLEKGAITGDQAVALWKAQGVPDTIAEGYRYIADQQHVGQDKLLARGQVITGYFDGLFTREQATGMLDDLGYRDDVAKEILDIADFRREIQAINSVVRKIANLYGSYRISTVNATSALRSVGIPDTQTQGILAAWDAVRSEPVRLPSTAEIGGAVRYGTLTQTQALQELAVLGYEPRDAAIVLSAHSQQAVTPLPPAGDTVTG